MKYIDPHVHMVSRTTDDYQAMADAGVVAVIEPAFWLGQLVAIGEIGFDEITPLEEKYFRLQLDIAADFGLPVLIHAPHRDKKRGTSLSMDKCREHGLESGMVVVDHNNEETVREVLERGFWAGFTIYPRTKMDSGRMAAIARQYGPERILVDSSADWGISDPLAVPRTARTLLDAGIPAAAVEAVCYGNALAAYGRSGKLSDADWLAAAPGSADKEYEGNSVLRGQPKDREAEPNSSHPASPSRK